MVTLKKCNKCGKEKEFNTTNFKPNKARKSGWESQCHECFNAYYREYSKKNVEWRREKERKYKENNPETYEAKVQRRRARVREGKLWQKYDNPEKRRVREQKRAKKPYRIAWERARWERRKANGYNEEYRMKYKENPLTRRLNVNRRRMRKLNIAGSHTNEQFMAKCEYHNNACYYCKTELGLSEMTMDHRIPISRGGTDFIANIVPCCRSCNASKRDKTDKEFFAWLSKLNEGLG